MARVGWAIGGLLATVPLALALGQAEIPVFIRLLLAGLWICAVSRPLVGLGVFLTVLPVAVPILGLAGPTPMTGDIFSDALAVAVLGGAALHLSWRYTIVPSRLAGPALVLGTLIATGAIVDLSVNHLLSPSTGDFARELWRHIQSTYFTDQRTLASWHMSAHWIEALALAVLLERTARQDERAGRLLGWAVATGLAAAAAFSGLRLVEIVLAASDRAEALVRHLTTTRVSPFLPDVNATGSLLALATVMWAIATTGPGRTLATRVLAAWPAGLTALALWLTGSRAAQAAAVAGLAAGLLWAYRVRTWVAGLCGASVVIMVAAATIILPARATQSDAAASLGVRVDMARISVQVARTAPAFGVGATHFREASIPFVSDALIERFPQTRVGENAHNQVLQILGEWGAIGVVCWMLLLVAAAGGLTDPQRSPWRAAIIGGWTAFLVSALFGHPWLMGPVVLITIPQLGLIAAGGTVSVPSPARRRLLLAAVVTLVIAIPVRAVDRRMSTDLDNYVVGASRTAGVEDGVPYRITRARSSWFVRVSAQVIEIPLRVDDTSGHQTCQVTMIVDGFPANVVSTSASEWTRVRFALTAGKYRQVNRRIDIVASPNTCGLRVGRFTTRD